MTLKVLMVDDSDIVLFLHHEILAEAHLSHNPLSALNGEIALNIMLNEENPDSHYLILLDINMPVMNGWEMLDALNENADKLPPYTVIMITSSIDARDKAKSRNYKNVFGFYEKPLTAKDCFEIKHLQVIEQFFNYD